MGEIRFVGPGETRGYPYLVCKKISLKTFPISIRFNYKYMAFVTKCEVFVRKYQKIHL